MYIRYWGIIILTAISFWIITSAYFVNVEYTDGYALIANAQYFLGQESINPPGQYFYQYLAARMPLGSILLIPAEWFATYLQLPAFDVRLHHLSYGLIHTLYIWLVYASLRYHYNNQIAVLVAFLITIPSFIFFSYAPFLSVDIYPGVIFLLMLLLAQRLSMQLPSWQIWGWLVLLGACAPLVKHTYAIFWIVIVVVYAIPMWWAGKYRNAVWLIGGAFASAVIAWLALSLVLMGWDHKTPFLLLPYNQVIGIVKTNPIEILDWPWWFYFKNFAAGYGVLTTILIVPGIVLALRGDDFLLKRIAMSWVLAFCIIVMIPYRETRYLLFLAPLTAFIIVLPVQQVLQHRFFWQVVLAVLLAFDLSRSAIEASLIYGNFFASDPIVKFLRVIDDTNDYKRPIFMPEDLSFTWQSYTPLAGDKLHRIIQLYPSLIVRLYNSRSILAIGEPRSTTREIALQKPETLPDKTVLLLANSLLYREMGAKEHYVSADDHVQMAAFTERVMYKKVGNIYVSSAVKKQLGPLVVFYRNEATPSELSYTMLGNEISDELIKRIGLISSGDLEICGFRLTAMCKASRCSFFP